MLRFLIPTVLLLSLASTAGADVPEYKEPDDSVVADQRGVIDQALKAAKTAQEDGTVDKILSQERSSIGALDAYGSGLGIKMPDFVEKGREDRYMAKAMAAGGNLGSFESASSAADYPIVLISLSMPESQIKELIQEAYSIGGAVAVRGLINDDFQATIEKLKQLSGEMEGGVFIDPTLFSRFSVSSVPTFILPIEPIALCTANGCPTPLHVKAEGSATLRYFLDLVERTGTDNEKLVAAEWLKRYGR